MLKVLYKHVQEIILHLSSDASEFVQFLSEVKQICKSMMKSDAVAHVFKGNHPDHCSYYNLDVPFKMCLPLVKKREVELRLGKCIVPCGKWKTLLGIMFHLHIEYGMKHLQVTGCLNQAFSDPRLYELAQELGQRFNNDITQEVRGTLTAREVNVHSIYFPPCMAHLYKILLTRHRLTHEARRQFTLFLKDAGMPVEEALTFWRNEYSKPSSHCGKGCTHSWQKDARRYRYSIRHMYGLEGGRYKYEVYSCIKIQGFQLTSLAEGGCPFQHFDNAMMMQTFPPQLVNDKCTVEKILNLKVSGKANEACHLFLSAQKNIKSRSQPSHLCQDEDNSYYHRKNNFSHNFINPVQFYISLRTWENLDNLKDSKLCDQT